MKDNRLKLNRTIKRYKRELLALCLLRDGADLMRQAISGGRPNDDWMRTATRWLEEYDNHIQDPGKKKEP